MTFHNTRNVENKVSLAQQNYWNRGIPKMIRTKEMLSEWDAASLLSRYKCKIEILVYLFNPSPTLFGSPKPYGVFNNTCLSYCST